MKFLFRYFFRTVRLVLAPVMILSEKLNKPESIERSPEAQAEVDAQCRSLALYQFKTCPFCIKVRREMHRLALPIELRDTQHDQARRTELEQGGGRVKVPCLQITDDSGKVEWMYESDAINRYLDQRFGQAMV
ncbi:glutaredoxin family protein [Phytohalomonas tamaricis]|uniref:glutaredoxin family protein n=1 Tax=Phytohalomonas tamaricis TaxID=2081032 RepID=UPI000D0B7025|nr:glutathione S-transferase N-terminal domain-containing protein [Phytohalomonas tamaricis]